MRFLNGNLKTFLLYFYVGLVMGHTKQQSSFSIKQCETERGGWSGGAQPSDLSKYYFFKMLIQGVIAKPKSTTKLEIVETGEWCEAVKLLL